jgi:hypothetical protein
MHKSIAAAIAAGLAAVALWAGITYISGFMLGFLAAFFGLAVGIAFRLADKENASTARGLTAAGITILAILVGKFAVARIAAAQSVEESYESDYATGSGDDRIIMDVADEIIWDREDAGIESDWPETESDEPSEYYPADVWAQAHNEFYNLTESEQQVVRDEYDRNLAGEAQGAASMLTILFFIFSFRPLDLIWLGTSIGTAYKLGTARADGEEPAPTEAAAPHFSSGSPLRGMPSAAASPPAPAPAQRDAA